MITFPAATRFNLATALIKVCRLTDKQLQTQFGPVCSRASQIGSGTAVINAAPLAAPINAPVKAYDRGADQLILVLRPVITSVKPPLRLPAPVEVIHVFASQSKLTVVVPRVIYGKLIPAVLVSLKLYLPALGTGGDALITAGRCRAGRFSVSERFTYADHAPVRLQSSSACT
jgi:hypothetical protein